MKQTSEKPHLILVHSAEFRNRIFQYHLDRKYQGSLKKLEDSLERRAKGKSVNVWALITGALESQKEYMQLTNYDKRKCRREISRVLYDNVSIWIRSQKNNPPVDNNYTGLEQIFNTFDKVEDEVDVILRLSERFTTIKSPSGWEVTR